MAVSGDWRLGSQFEWVPHLVAQCGLTAFHALVRRLPAQDQP